MHPAAETAGLSFSVISSPLLAYYEIGVSTFLIRGFNPLHDAIDYGRDIIPRVRAEIAARDAAATRHAARSARTG